MPMVMSKIHNVFIKQHQRGRWRYHWGFAHPIASNLPILPRDFANSGTIIDCNGTSVDACAIMEAEYLFPKTFPKC